MLRSIRGDRRDDTGNSPLRLPELPRAPESPGASLAQLFIRSWSGRLLLVSAALKAALVVVERATGLALRDTALDAVTSVVLFVTLLIVAWRAVAIARRRLLWRVRRRLIISYIFIGVVPALLIVSFFVLAGFMMFLNISAYLFKRGIDDVVDEAVVVA